MSYCKQIVYLYVSILALILAACCVQAETAPNVSIEEGSMQQAQTVQTPEPVLEAQRRLAEQLGVTVNEVEIVEAEQADWPDSCLGLGGADESCAQVITPGWRAIFEVNGEEHEVRTDEEASIIRLANEEASGPGDGADGLVNTEWRLVSFGPDGSETPAIEESNVTLEFGDEGNVSGFGGCNSYSGNYQTEDGTISFSDIVNTLIACANEDVTRQETTYLQALNIADEFHLEDDRLTIAYDDGLRNLHFERALASA